MNCFNHGGVPAIGICKACGKALCGECLAEVPNGLACKGRCEGRVNMINRMLDANGQVMRAARHQVKSSGLISLTLGVGCCFFAVWSFLESDSFLPYFIGLLGISCVVSGCLRLSRKEAYPSEAGESR